MSIVKKIEARVKKIEKHGATVCTLTMAPVATLPEFRPGQFLHLALDPYTPSAQWPESRVFSIQSPPTRKQDITITYAIKGNYTKRMYESLREEDTIWIKLPYGNFFFDDTPGEKILIAGGTGITPFLSFLTHECDRASAAQIRLFYGVRNPDLIIFNDELEECRKKLKNFSLVVFSENQKTGNNGYEEGQLNIDRILKIASGIEDKEFYISGPPQMIFRFSEELAQRKIERQRIHIDAWE